MVLKAQKDNTMGGELCRSLRSLNLDMHII